jgi:RND family efflux transporter MFP subunit
MYLKKCKTDVLTLPGLIGLFFLLFFPLVNAEQVKAGTVKSWHHGEQVLLYCAVVTPFKNQISSYADAELVWLLPEGSLAKKGEVVARQDDFHLKRKRKMLDIQMSDATSKVDFSHKEYTRLQMLSKAHVSRSALNRVKRQYQEAKHQLAEMEQQGEVINYRLSRLEHRAPVLARVANLMANLGENIAAGQAILQLIPTLSKELACSIPLDIYQKFTLYNKQGLSSLEFLFDKKHALTFKREQALANQVEQSLTVYLSLSAELQTRLVIGKRVQVTMYQERKNTTQVPFDAMVLEHDGNYVWVIDRDNKVSKQPVVIVSAQATSFIVRSALQVGAQVVVRGKQSMQAGIEVSLVLDVL